uniref:uncharacterized mitochondrial protein AtMg00810-like n=1 Tax=Erigeron canadensis TaxID=72917 RepID=UPI001CB8D290|nr:uncharacterized mitochondrial protein AtMg00810-like [Erigeron canadensis]
MYLLVYVDDLILTRNHEPTLRAFVTKLNEEFAIKDLGNLSYFLGLKVCYMQNGLFLHQAKYASEIIDRASMCDCKPISTPLSTNVVLTAEGDRYSNPTLYRSLVGALQYLTITHLDISYAVNQVSQFLHCPTVTHFQELKRIIRYIKGTITHGLNFTKPKHCTLVGYSDVDWARCIDTR